MQVTLTAAESKVIVREIEFSVNMPMAAIIKAFPSVTFSKPCNNGGVTYVYTLTGPKIWVEKINRKYAY